MPGMALESGGGSDLSFIQSQTLDEKRHFVRTIEAARVPMILSDPGQRGCPIVCANDAFLNLTGYRRAEVVGRNHHFMYGEKTDPAAAAELGAAFRERRSAMAELVSYRRDGTPFLNAVVLSPLLSGGGDILYYFATYMDVTCRAAARIKVDETRAAAARERLSQLSPREAQVLKLLSDGLINKQVAHTLGLSTRTVELYRARLMSKLGVQSLPAAVRLFLEAA